MFGVFFGSLLRRPADRRHRASHGAAAAAVVGIYYEYHWSSAGHFQQPLERHQPSFFQALANLWQQVVYPIALINQARLLVLRNSLHSFAAWLLLLSDTSVSGVPRCQIRLHCLRGIMRNGSVATSANSRFRCSGTTFQPLPPAANLINPGDRQRVDMSDALAMDTSENREGI